MHDPPIPNHNPEKMKDQKIYSVSEAFGMQPLMWSIGNTYFTRNPLSRIVKEDVFDTGDPFDFYVGYDSEDKRVFQIPVKCAVVQFT